MNKTCIKLKKGFTLVEAIAAITLFTVAMGLAMTGMIFMLKNHNQDNTQYILDMDIKQALERLKHDMRLSSLNECFFYQETDGSYQAISFPLGELDENGILKKDIDGQIDWSDQVIYHIKSTTPYQLIKTTFSNRQKLTDEQRRFQLESVVNNGDASLAQNSANATSTVVFENLLNWKLIPTAGRFDAYHPYYIREKASLGYALLDSGEHKITFTAVDPADGGNRYAIGIDQLFASVSSAPKEGEHLNVIANSGPAPYSQYTTYGTYYGKHQLLFPATGEGQSFSVNITNDVWRETNFIESGHQTENTEAEFDLTLKDYVVRLEGQANSWRVENQTDDPGGSDSSGMLKTAVRIFLKGNELADSIGFLEASGRRCKLTFAASSTEDLRVSGVCIGESSSTNTITMDYAAPPEVVTFGGPGTTTISKGTKVTSDWVDLEIDKHKNYLVSYFVDEGFPKKWKISDGASSGTAMVLEGATESMTDDTSWSGGSYSNYIFGLESVFVSYAASGTYTSRIFDTQDEQPKYENLTTIISSPQPANTGVSTLVRTADRHEDIDTSAWTSFNLASYKRYIQFQATLTSDSQGESTPILKDVIINWDGEERLVDIGGFFSKGPELGTFEVMVDDKPLTSALIVELEIYDDTVRGMNDQNRRISSALKMDLTPRNTGKSKSK